MPPVIQNRNRTVRVDTTQITENALSKTFLTADAAAGASTLTVANIEKFAIGKYIWFNPGAERGEIVAVHASTAPTGTTITLATTTVNAHYTGEPIHYVEFNQVEISNAATLTGSKSVLTTTAFAGGERETVYLDTASSSGYYFARFKDSVAATFGNYSDGNLYGGFAFNTVGYMIDKSLRSLELKLSEKVTTQDCYDWLSDGIRLVQGKLKRWPEHYTYNSAVAQTVRGVNIVTLPTDIYDAETNKSITGFRIGDSKNLQYLDPKTFDIQMGDVRYNPVTSQASVGATSLNVTNTYDFDDTGSVVVYVSGTKYTLTYTGVTRSTTVGAFTGIPASGTGSITAIIPAATPCWQLETEGVPQWYTVRNGQAEFWPLCDSAHDNMNVYMDYSHVATTIDSEGDTIDLQRADMLQQYLTWRMYSKAMNRGVLDMGAYRGRMFVPNGWYAAFQERLKDAIQTLPQSNVFKIVPRLNRMLKSPGINKPDLQDLTPSQQ